MAAAPSAPFSGQQQPPANIPTPAWHSDQPRPPVIGAYDPNYHGHTFQSFSAPMGFDGFDLKRVRSALSLHRIGNFIESSLLCQVVLGFAPVMAALSQRMAPALALPRHIRAGTRGLSRRLGEDIEAQITPRDGLIPSDYFPSTLYGSTIFDLAMMGFSVWQHAFGEPDPDTGIRPLYTRRWPTWAIQYYRYRRTYVAITTDGPVDILNDGKFTLIGDSEEPHFFGAILALAEEAFDGLCTRRARASFIDRYGNPKWIATMPPNVAPRTPEGDAMMQALATIRGPDGFGIVPNGTTVDIKGLTTADSKTMGDALASNWQHIAATLLGSDGTMTRGTGVYSAPIFAGVRRDLVDRDLRCVVRGVNQGHIGTWLRYNYAETIAAAGNWIQPALDIPLPDPDADARIKSYGDRVKRFHEIISAERSAGFEITQDRVNQLAGSLEIDVPVLAKNPQLGTVESDAPETQGATDAREAQSGSAESSSELTEDGGTTTGGTTKPAAGDP